MDNIVYFVPFIFLLILLYFIYFLFRISWEERKGKILINKDYKQHVVLGRLFILLLFSFIIENLGQGWKNFSYILHTNFIINVKYIISILLIFYIYKHMNNKHLKK